MLEIVPIPAFADNYIWALLRDDHCVVVDPGDATPVIAFLAARNLTLDAILITHHHADHVGGVAALTARWPVSVYGPAAENIKGVTHALRENDQVALPKFVDEPFRVMEVPGHTSGHIAYVSGDILFCGDTLFAAGCGRMFEGTAQQLHTSLMRLAALPGTTRVFCTPRSCDWQHYRIRRACFAHMNTHCRICASRLPSTVTTPPSLSAVLSNKSGVRAVFQRCHRTFRLNVRPTLFYAALNPLS